MFKYNYSSLIDRSFGQNTTKCKLNKFYKYGLLSFIGSAFLTGLVLCAYNSNAFSNRSPIDYNDTTTTTVAEIVEEVLTTVAKIVEEEKKFEEVLTTAAKIVEEEKKFEEVLTTVAKIVEEEKKFEEVLTTVAKIVEEEKKFEEVPTTPKTEIVEDYIEEEKNVEEVLTTVAKIVEEEKKFEEVLTTVAKIVEEEKNVEEVLTTPKTEIVEEGPTTPKTENVEETNTGLTEIVEDYIEEEKTFEEVLTTVAKIVEEEKNFEEVPTTPKTEIVEEEKKFEEETNTGLTTFNEPVTKRYVTKGLTTFNEPVTKRYVTKGFVYIKPISEKSSIKSIYINLDFQTKCEQRTDNECWNALALYDSNYVVSVQVLVKFVMRNCKAIESKCPIDDKKRCFQQICSQNPSFLIFFNQLGSSVSIQPENVYFLLTTGNYHSSWQSEGLSTINRENMVKTQKLIKKINVFKNIPPNQLFLSYTKVVECVQCNTRGVNIPKRWVSEQNTILPVTIENYNYDSTNVYMYYSLYSVINVKKDFVLEGHLHDRLNEFINTNILSSLIRKVYINSTTSLNLYSGKYTISTVLTDSRINNRLRDIIYFYDKSPMLIIKDMKINPSYHINNWGTELYGSNYDHIYFNIGKYTRMVMKDVGFELV